MNSLNTSSNIKELENAVEHDLIFQIIQNMKDSKITVGEAKKLAHEYLALLPFSDKEDVLKKLQKLGMIFSEAQSVYLKLATEEEKQKKSQLLSTVSEHLHNGDIDQALSVMKGAH